MAADEQVSAVGRFIRTIKDCAWCRVRHLKFSYYPKSLMVGCLIAVTKSLNNEIGMSSLIDEYSPFTLIIGQPVQTHKQLVELSYGDYVYIHTKDISNTMDSRTIPAISLYPSGNLQQGWKFMSLNTRREVHRKLWK